MALYVKPPPGKPSSSSSSGSSSEVCKKRKKDPSAPKRAKTGWACACLLFTGSGGGRMARYMLFTDENRERVRAQLKEKADFKNQDVLTELGKQWKLLPEVERQVGR